jgi:probable HAF family extracellular repeat protein
MIDLGGFGGTLGFANALNNRGQVVGQSNLQGNQAVHPFLWDRGTMKDLGTLGGSSGVAFAINDAGSVTGWAHPAGDEEIHGFLWMHGVMKDLGTLDGHICNFPNSINARGQVVGQSNACQDPNQPFLWENGGPMVNLNDLIVPGSQINMRVPMFINNRGEIGGFGRLPNDDFRAVVLIPCDGNQSAHHPDAAHCDALAENAPAGSQHIVPPSAQPVSKEAQIRLVRETMVKLRTQSGRYRGAGAQPPK